jgi:hypothetical protein
MYSTRNDEGVITVYKNLEDAIKAFLSDGGYRLDLVTDNDIELYIYRSDLEHDKFSYHKADAKVVAVFKEDTPDNVIQVDFS